MVDFADMGGKFPILVCFLVVSVAPPSWQVKVSGWATAPSEFLNEPVCAPIWARMPIACPLCPPDRTLACSQPALLSRVLLAIDGGIEIAPAILSEGAARDAWTDSAANQFGASQSAQNPRGILPSFCPRFCPSPDLGEDFEHDHH